MKTIKIIIAVLLLILLLPTSGCVFSQVNTELEANLGSLPVNILTDEEKTELPKVLENVEKIRMSLSFFVVSHFIFVLSAGVSLLCLKNKYYSSLLAGGLVLVSFVWNASLQKAITGVVESVKKVACATTLPYIEDSLEHYGYLSMGTANFLLFLPMALLLVIGVVEVLAHFLRKGKETVSAEPVISESKETNIEDIKKYKELLDQGIITQEEFDAKKKALLDL